MSTNVCEECDYVLRGPSMADELDRAGLHINFFEYVMHTDELRPWLGVHHDDEGRVVTIRTEDEIGIDPFEWLVLVRCEECGETRLVDLQRFTGHCAEHDVVGVAANGGASS